jgi:hypothetical protein
MQPPATEERALLVALRGRNDELRDPREITTLLQRTGKPLLLIDESREKDFVFWSCVAVESKSIWELNARLDAARIADPRVRATGRRLLRETAPALVAYRRALDEALSRSRVLRAGIGYEQLRLWRREHRFEVVAQQSNTRFKEGEFAGVLSLVGTFAERLGLEGVVVAIVDAAMQNGLDPSQLRLASDELMTILIDDEIRPRLIWASTPESRDVGALLDLPDLDGAHAVLEPTYEEFSSGVRAATAGEVTYWMRPAAEPMAQSAQQRKPVE